MTHRSRVLCIGVALVTLASAPTDASSAESDDVRRARPKSFKTFTVARLVESGPSTPAGTSRVQLTPVPPIRPLFYVTMSSHSCLLRRHRRA